MIAIKDFLQCVGFLLAAILVSPSTCQDGTKCLQYLDEVREILGSKIPPINDSRMTDNYYNISRALYPSVDLPALYVRVTIQFLRDFQNGTKRIDDQKKNLKFTWSKACSYVSVKHISLNAMSVYSLFTIYPQRRQTELVVTVPPFCSGSPYATNDVTREWRYVVSTLEDIIINPKISDPRLNSACCVVSGHEGDITEYPNLWWFCWFILFSSFFASLFLWIFLLQSISDNMVKEITETPRIVCGAALKMTCPISVISFLAVVILVPVLGNCFSVPKMGENQHIYYGVYIGLVLLSFFIPRCLRCLKCICNRNVANQKKNYTYYGAAFFLFPCLFQTFHHFLWAICGIISEPFWGIPIFLLECLFFASILFALCLYEKQFAETSSLTFNIQSGDKCVIIHLFFSCVSFALVLITIALIAVNNGNAVASPTAGAIESVMTVIFIWLVKNSRLDFWSKESSKFILVERTINGLESGETQESPV